MHTRTMLLAQRSKLQFALPFSIGFSETFMSSQNCLSQIIILCRQCHMQKKIGSFKVKVKLHTFTLCLRLKLQYFHVWLIILFCIVAYIFKRSYYHDKTMCSLQEQYLNRSRSHSLCIGYDENLFVSEQLMFASWWNSKTDNGDARSLKVKVTMLT